MATIRIERGKRLTTLRFDRPHGNAINPEFVGDLLAALAGLENDDAVRGLMLASAHPKIFCPGLDLRELYPLSRVQMEGFLERFCEMVHRLFVFPKPVAAAIGGHAVAGGCVLALACDWRVLSDGGAMIGLNEVRLGVGLPWSVATLMRNAVAGPRQTEAALMGRNFSGADAVAAGMAQEIAPAGQVEARAEERLGELADKEPAAFGAIKGFLRGDAGASMRDGDRRHADLFLDLWFSEPTRRLVGETVRQLEARG